MNEKTLSFYRLNTPFGLLMGICFIVASLLTLKNTGIIYGNATLSRTISFLYIIGLYIQLRNYRESKMMNGFISYGTAFWTGLWISFMCSLLYGIYIGIIYNLNPQLVTNFINTAEPIIEELYSNTKLKDSLSVFFKLFISPLTLGILEMISLMITGTLYSLIIAFFIQKKDINI